MTAPQTQFILCACVIQVSLNIKYTHTAYCSLFLVVKKCKSSWKRFWFLSISMLLFFFYFLPLCYTVSIFIILHSKRLTSFLHSVQRSAIHHWPPQWNGTLRLQWHHAASLEDKYRSCLSFNRWFICDMVKRSPLTAKEMSVHATDRLSLQLVDGHLHRFYAKFK